MEKVIDSVQFSCSVVSNSLQPHGLQHTRPPCPLPTSGVYSNSCPLSQWCHPTISSSVVPFSSHLQSCPASGSFEISQFFASGGQRTGVSASASVLPKSIQGWFPLRLTGLISLQSRGLFKRLLQHDSSKASILWCSAFFTVQLSHLYITTGKTIALTIRTFVGKVMSLLFSTATAALTAKSLQSCPTLCDPIDGSPPGSPVPGILQARTPEWVAISFSNVWKWKVKVKSLSHIRLLVTPWTAAHQAPPPMGFSRQGYWSGVPLPSPF